MNNYCVPFAFGYVSGRTPDEVAAVISTERMERGDTGMARAVRAVWGFEFGVIMRALGIKVTAYVGRPNMTLRKWANVRAKWGDDKRWLVRMSGHMVVYHNGLFYDNQCHKGATPEAFKYGNSRLKEAWQVA